MSRVTWDTIITDQPWIKGKSVKELKNNGYFERNGETYVCLYPADATNYGCDGGICYTASAIKLDDKIECDTTTEYIVTWLPVEDYEEFEREEDHCDWENPDFIEERGVIKVR